MTASHPVQPYMVLVLHVRTYECCMYVRMSASEWVAVISDHSHGG
jgi:hypothetical protein